MGMIRQIPKITAVWFGLVIVIFHLVVRADKFSREGSHLPDKKKIRISKILDLVYLS